MNQCFDLCGLPCSREEIKTSLTIPDSHTCSSPSRSSSAAVRSLTGRQGTSVLWMPQTRLGRARTGLSRVGTDLVLSRPTPSGATPVLCSPRPAGAEGAGGERCWGHRDTCGGSRMLRVQGARPSQRGDRRRV